MPPTSLRDINGGDIGTSGQAQKPVPSAARKPPPLGVAGEGTGWIEDVPIPAQADLADGAALTSGLCWRISTSEMRRTPTPFVFSNTPMDVRFVEQLTGDSPIQAARNQAPGPDSTRWTSDERRRSPGGRRRESSRRLTSAEGR